MMKNQNQIIVHHKDGGSVDLVSYEPSRRLTRLRIHNHDCPQFGFYIEPQLLNIYHLTENERTYIDLSTVLRG